MVENQIQQARVAFNLMTDIPTKYLLFCFIVTSLPLQFLTFLRKDFNVIMRILETDDLKMSTCERRCVDFTPKSQCFGEIWLNDVDHYVLLWHLLHFQSPKM